MKIDGTTALVTGANRGLGAAITRALIDAGAKVYGAARDTGGGALVNVLSVLSFISIPQAATYSASRARRGPSPTRCAWSCGARRSGTR